VRGGAREDAAAAQRRSRGGSDLCARVSRLSRLHRDLPVPRQRQHTSCAQLSLQSVPRHTTPSSTGPGGPLLHARPAAPMSALVLPGDRLPLSSAAHVKLGPGLVHASASASASASAASSSASTATVLHITRAGLLARTQAGKGAQGRWVETNARRVSSARAASLGCLSYLLLLWGATGGVTCCSFEAADVTERLWAAGLRSCACTRWLSASYTTPPPLPHSISLLPATPSSAK
jgi:hypothetical protein